MPNGAPLNRDFMKKLVGKSHGVDTSHIKVKTETGTSATGFKPTAEEVEKWQRGESIDPDGNVKASSPINIQEANKSMMKSLLIKQSGGSLPVPKAPMNLGGQKTAASAPAISKSSGSGDSMEFKYNPSSPIPDLDRSYAPKAPKAQTPTDLPRTASSGHGSKSLVEARIQEDLPADRIRGLLQGLGEAMVGSSGGRYGVTDFFPFNGTSYEVTFQHRLQEGNGGDSGLQIEISMNPENVISTATVSITLLEGEAVSQSISRSYLNPASLVDDLPNLIDMVGENV